jgi:hypothetical protein
MATIKKYQKGGKTPAPTYKNLRMGVANARREAGQSTRGGYGASSADSAAYRFGFGRGLKGEKEYPGEGPVQKMGRWEGQNVGKTSKKKMMGGGKIKKAQAGLKASTKRVGPVDPNGAWTKVQMMNLPPRNVKTKVSLTKDKQQGATSMTAKRGIKVAKAKGGKWIQSAIKKPGALRAQLGAKPGKPIPAAKLAKAAKAKGKLGQRARLAQTLKKMRKK